MPTIIVANNINCILAWLRNMSVKLP